MSGADTNRVVGSVQPVNNTFSTTINIPADTTTTQTVTITYTGTSSLPDTYEENTTYNLSINIPNSINGAARIPGPMNPMGTTLFSTIITLPSTNVI